jgi:ABC-2 type transport system permease protein
LLAGLVLLAAPLVGVHPGAAGAAGAAGLLLLVGFALTSLSLAIAWRLRSTQGFHAIMTLFLMPLWLLSGAFFPAAGAPAWLAALMAADPLTYGVAALRHLLGEAAGGGAGAPLPGLPFALLVTGLFALVAFASALVVAHRVDGGDAA